MKSIEIINYIDSLNEDAYSKFTLNQLYTKLGHDRFMKYVKGVVDSVIRRLDTKSPIKTVIPEVAKYYIDYNVDVGRFNDSLSIQVPGGDSGYIRVVYNLDVRYVLFEQKDLSLLLNQVITQLYNDSDAKHYRDRMLNLPSNKTKISDYNNHSFEDLVSNISFKKIKPYLQETFSESLKASSYVPLPHLRDLRDSDITVRSVNSRTVLNCNSTMHFTPASSVGEYFVFSYSLYKKRLDVAPHLKYILSYKINNQAEDDESEFMVSYTGVNFRTNLQDAIDKCISTQNIQRVKTNLLALLKNGV